MTKIASGHSAELAAKLGEIFGVNPKCMLGINIDIQPHSAVTARLTLMVTEDQMTDAMKELAKLGWSSPTANMVLEAGAKEGSLA